jgi:hypothetical protein
MPIRKLNIACLTLAAGLILLGGPVAVTRAQEVCAEEECCEEGGSGFRDRCKGLFGRGCRRRNNCRHWQAVDANYCDPRDMQLHSDQGYGVPIAVPLAPTVRHTYHYGWGMPSSRLVRVGARYNQWHPDTLYSQSGGSYGGGQFPMIYQPTDTTQLGAYHVHAPRWRSYRTR